MLSFHQCMFWVPLSGMSQLMICWLFSWHFILLSCLCVFLPLAWCFDYYNILGSFEVKTMAPLLLSFFTGDYFGYLEKLLYFSWITTVCFLVPQRTNSLAVWWWVYKYCTGYENCLGYWGPFNGVDVSIPQTGGPSLFLCPLQLISWIFYSVTVDISLLPGWIYS